MSHKRKPNGVIIYEGPSMLDGEPIVVIVTGLRRTDNRKTGTMLSTWILLQDTPPCDAANQGLDISICGSCKHRTWGTCYVNLGYSPYNVYKAYKRGSYPNINDVEIDIKHRTMRIGSYGDPAAVPNRVWQDIIGKIKGVTGYTHQWKSNRYLSNYCMASVDSVTEAIRAKALGFRTFRIVLEGEKLLPDEYHCPADKAVGRKATCDNCLGCNGFFNGGDKKNPVITLHGSNSKVLRYKRIMKLRNRKKGFKHLIPTRITSPEKQIIS